MTALPEKVDRRRPSPWEEREHATLMGEAEALWSDDTPASKSAALDTWDRATQIIQDNALAHERAAHASFELAQHTHHQRDALFLRGMEYAERGLRARYPRYEWLRRRGSPMVYAIEALPQDTALGLLLWFARNLDGWLDASGSSWRQRQYAPLMRAVLAAIGDSPDPAVKKLKKRWSR